MVDAAQMEEGQKGRVVEIQGGFGVTRRMETMGIRPGIEVTKISSQIMRGPVILQVGNTQVGIGFGMAKKIMVRVQ